MANKRRTNTAGADEIAHVIHRMVDAMQLMAVQPRAMVAPTRPATMEDFMRQRPVKFIGKATPDGADAWLRECEKICQVINCRNAQKLTFDSPWPEHSRQTHNTHLFKHQPLLKDVWRKKQGDFRGPMMERRSLRW